MVAPTLRGVPGIGAVDALVPDRLAILRRVARECGPAGSFRIGPHHVAVTSDPALVRSILQDIHGFPQPEVIQTSGRTVIGNGLLTVRSADHAQARAQLRPLFAPDVLASFIPGTHRVVDTMVASWPATRPVELVEAARKLMAASRPAASCSWTCSTGSSTPCSGRSCSHSLIPFWRRHVG
jgi:cytochrome P450